MDLERVGIDARELVAPKLGKERNASRIHHHAIGISMRRRHGDQFHFTGARYQPAHHIGALDGSHFPIVSPD